MPRSNTSPAPGSGKGWSNDREISGTASPFGRRFSTTCRFRSACPLLQKGIALDHATTGARRHRRVIRGDEAISPGGCLLTGSARCDFPAACDWR